MEIFWKTIAYYNSATWIYQLLIIVAGLLLTVMLIKNPRPWVKMGMKLYMVFLYLWIAIAYYAICCDERSYNGALAMFWIVMATIWVWDAITGYTTFERTHKYDMLSYVLLALPFVYPLVSVARGLAFPGITSPVMPCSVTVFTINNVNERPIAMLTISRAASVNRANPVRIYPSTISITPLISGTPGTR